MNQRAAYESLGNRVAEEAQLLAEEKWILEALEKVKTQRNCLQIERLQLESMKKQLEISPGKSSVDEPRELKSAPVTFSEERVQAPAPTSPDAGAAKKHLLEAEALCNKEELNLNVTNSVFSQIPLEDLNAEEDEDEFDDEENGEDLLIDMDMFMHGSQTNFNSSES